MDCCRKPYNILTATGLMPSGDSQPCCGLFTTEFVFPNQPYSNVDVTYSEFISIQHSCSEPIQLLVVVTEPPNQPGTKVFMNVGVDSIEMHINGSDVVSIPPGANTIFFSLENSNYNNTNILISFFNITCNVDYGQLIGEMNVWYVP